MSKYAKYVIREPELVKEMVFHDFKRQLAGFTLPSEIFIDKQVLKEGKQYVDIA